MSETATSWLLWATAVTMGLQALLLSVDELVYHRRRGLGRFERIGHPVDSFCFFLPLAVQAWLPAEAPYTYVYVVLALLSSLVITKDEFIHVAHCSASEQWLHAMLFVVHAPVLVGLGALWWLDAGSGLRHGAPWMVLGFLTHQIVYWGFHARAGEGQQRVL